MTLNDTLIIYYPINASSRASQIKYLPKRDKRSISDYTGAFSCLPLHKGEGMQQKRYRPDKDGTHRGAFERNKKKIYATQKVCGICGQPVDFSAKYPHPLSPCIDHIIPVAKGGHPSELGNLQLAHWACNRAKSDKLFSKTAQTHEDGAISNRNLPQSCDWTAYSGD